MEFGHKKKHDFGFGKSTGATHCPRCMRSKEEAISEQLQLRESCDDQNCFFAKEIRQAIRESKYSRYCINCGNEFQTGDKYCIVCGLKRITL